MSLNFSKKSSKEIAKIEKNRRNERDKRHFQNLRRIDPRPIAKVDIPNKRSPKKNFGTQLKLRHCENFSNFSGLFRKPKLGKILREGHKIVLIFIFQKT